MEHYNTPGRFYFPLDGTQEKQSLVTYFSFSAGPSLTKDRLFSNSVGVSVSSFATRADAAAMFDLSTFQVWVAGTDQTRHFLETAAKHPSRWRQVGNTTAPSGPTCQSEADDSKCVGMKSNRR